MTIGELDRRITIDYPAYATNDYGESVADSYYNFRTVWAKVEWDGGSETDETDKITGITKVNFYIRNLDLDTFLDGSVAPTLAYRVVFDNHGETKYYYIHAINEIAGSNLSNRERFLKIETKEKDS